MMAQKNSAKMIFSVATVLLVVFAYLSRDVNKEAYRVLNQELEHLRYTSLKLDDELLKVRGGYAKSYDELSFAIMELRLEVENLKISTFQSFNSKFDRTLSRLGLIAKPLKASAGPIEVVAEERQTLLERFKADLAIAMTAKTTALVMLRDLQSGLPQGSPWLDALRNLEMELVVIDESVDSSRLMAYWQEVVTAKAKTVSSDKKMIYELLSMHIKNVSEKSPLVNRMVRQEVHLAKMMESEINIAMERLERDYSNFEQVSYRYRVCFSVVCLFIVIYGAMQTRRAVSYANEIEEANKTLEDKVTRRTVDLEGALAKIKSDSKKKQVLIEQMKVKDRELANSEAFFRAITQNANNQIILVDEVGRISYANPQAVESFGVHPDGHDGSDVTTIFPSIASIDHLVENLDQDIVAVGLNGTPMSMKCSVNQFKTKEGDVAFAIIMHDFTELKSLEEELAHAHKLESVGQLAAGIAHEINTPAQFISDNLSFLGDAVSEVFELLGDISAQCGERAEDESLKMLAEKIEQADLEYLQEEIPSALAQSSEGIERVTTIVRAMKDYAHPGESFGSANINDAIEAASIVCRNEWKFVANLEMELEPELPLVECVISDINQVVLNMVVNAAHAIGDSIDVESGGKGQIQVKTLSSEEEIEIHISDNGSGMSEAVREKIFDQFYTTKAVGRGTGQGLSIAYKLVVSKHGGKIDVQSEEGVGTTFVVTLPLEQPDQEENLRDDQHGNQSGQKQVA